VPRESVRDVEGRIRKIEDHVKSLEDEHWRKTNPETKARSEGLRGQLEASIAELKAEIEGAKDAKAKAEAEQKLATQESWLAAIGD
jgi:ribosome-interacting GTPase 1